MLHTAHDRGTAPPPQLERTRRARRAGHGLRFMSAFADRCIETAKSHHQQVFRLLRGRHPNVTFLSTDLCHTPGHPWRFQGVRSRALLQGRPCRWRRTLPAVLSRAAVGRGGSGRRGACVSLVRCRASSRWRGGICGCERQVRTCPSKTKPASWGGGRTGFKLADTPYHFLLKLQLFLCMAGLRRVRSC